MTQYIVEMNINDQFLVDAEDAEDAVLQAESLAADSYDVEVSDITVVTIKEVK